ncbi:MAG: ribosome recycling factor, partial [Firmicutes bacterium]|nr:ribosome recycling factor [Bacillota bacterium]
MSITTDNYQEHMDKTISVLKQELNTVRAGRANAALLDQVVVDYYGSPTPVKNLSNISVPDPRTLMITPFDPSSIKAIEKAILTSNLGINPSNDGRNI